MGHFSVKIIAPNGSNLNGNQHSAVVLSGLEAEQEKRDTFGAGLANKFGQKRS